MTDTEQRYGRFGTASPGARPQAPSLDPILSGEGPPRRRFTRGRILAAGIALVVAGGAYLGGHFTAPTPPATRLLLVTSSALPAGTRLTSADLSTVRVLAGEAAPPGALGPDAAASVDGLVTTTALPAGTFLSRSLLSSSGEVPGSGQTLVGLALKPGQLPAGGLADGQQVLVVLLPQTSDGTPLQPVSLVTTTVWDVQGSSSQGTTQATVVVPAGLAVRLAQYAAQSQVALIQTAASAGGTP